ncbi:MAG: hypothetical protein OES13_02960 [Acidimicrobiia bacterium]|nr:hypothetical protein [Acidimicrobiia bacterium]
MGATKEIPELVSEFVDMSKEYLRQETVGRAQLLGRHAGVGMASAFASALAVIFLSVAGVRLLIDAMPGEPSHQMWSGLAYVTAAVVLAGIAGIIVARVSR